MNNIKTHQDYINEGANYCYYKLEADKWGVIALVMVVENVPGYIQLHRGFMDDAEAKETVDGLNDGLGLEIKTVCKIVSSSMKAQELSA